METPFDAWLERAQPLPRRFYAAGIGDIVTEDWHCWVSPFTRTPLHLATSLDWISLRDSREKTQRYIQAVSNVVKGLPGWLDREETEMLTEAGLIPPQLCSPIYLITCGNADSEQIVYVGQTSSSNRFSGGHAAALKLHDPAWNSYQKWIYQCSVCLLQEKEYLYLEWLDPAETAEAVLNDVESQLIFDLQPALNSSKRKTHSAKTPLCIHMQNTVAESRLKDKFFYPPA